MAMRRDALSRAHRLGRTRWNGRQRPGRLLASVAMLVVIVACGIGAYTWNAQRGDVYRTVSGERRLITLEDGSKISLDARDRKSVVEGKSVSVRVDLGGRRIIKKKKKRQLN